MATADEVGEYLDLNRRTVHEYVARGILPQRGDDGWDLQECLRLYLNHLRRQILQRRFTRTQIDHLAEAGLINPEILDDQS